MVSLGAMFCFLLDNKFEEGGGEVANRLIVKMFILLIREKETETLSLSREMTLTDNGTWRRK